MKSVSIFCGLAIAAWLSGCASDRSGLVLDPVGPPPGQSSTTSSSTNGTLVVYSAYDVDANWNARDPRRPVYSNYKIFFPDGNLLRAVHNDSGTMLQDAKPVELPRGKYRVVARANGYGRVTIPVVIEACQTTVLHLEGGGSWSNEAEFNQTNAVRLPDGQIVGWRTTAEHPSKL
ncbi:MAG: hypothetical protein ACLQAH_11725 [Limisphaerales bacterium]